MGCPESKDCVALVILVRRSWFFEEANGNGAADAGSMTVDWNAGQDGWVSRRFEERLSR